MKIEEDVASIYFSGSVLSEDIEREARSLSASKQLSRVNVVYLNLASVHTIDGFSIALLLAFMRWLTDKRGKELLIKLPSERSSRGVNLDRQRRSKGDQGTHQLLSSFRLREAFRRLGAKIAGSEHPEIFPEASEAEVSQFRTLSNQADLTGLLEATKGDQQLILFFRDAWDYELIQSGKLRDVILFELGINVFEHANAYSAYIAMNVSETEPSYVVPWMKRFVHGAVGNTFLEIIIADDGLGLFRTLVHAYLEDPSVTVKPPTETSIVEYAFRPHSTRKKRAERLQRYEEILGSSDHSGLIPPTGLYWVKEIAREFGGLLALRTGSTLAYFDFLNNPDQDQPFFLLEVETGGRRSPKRVHLPGVQLALYFPLKRSLRSRQPLRSTSMREQDLPSHKTILIPTHRPKGISLEDASGQASFILDTIDRASELRSSGNFSRTLVLDMRDLELSTKALFILVVELMRLQDTTTSIVPINASSLSRLETEITSLLLGEATKQPSLPRERPLLLFDDEWGMHFIGLEPAAERRIKEFRPSLIRRASTQAEDVEKIIKTERLQHLLRVNSDSGEAGWLISLREVRGLAESNLRRDLADYVADASNGIFHKKHWFLVPSGVYVHGFFEIRKFLERDVIRAKFLSWCQLAIDDLSVQAVLVIGLLASELGEAISSIYGDREVIAIPNAEKATSWYKVALLEPGTKLVILVGGIVTGRTIENLLDQLPAVEVAKILSVVDSRQSESERGLPPPFIFNRDEIALHSLLRYPLALATDLPLGCEYDDIIVIDPISASPVWDTEQHEQILRKGTQELLRLLRESDSAAVGHFSINSRHILYYVMTPELARHFGDDFAEVIREDVSRHYKRRKASLSISAVAYPEESRGAEVVAQEIARAFDGTSVLALSGKTLDNPSRFPWTGIDDLHDVVVFDNAIGTGETFWRMIEVLENWGAKRVFVYALIRRANRQPLGVHEKVKRFGGCEVELKYLYDLRIPNYSDATCPVCRRRAQYERLRSTLPDGSPEGVSIDERIKSLQVRSARLLAEMPTRLAFLRGVTEERIESFRLRILLEEARSEPAARNALAELVRSVTGPSSTVNLLCSILARESIELLDIKSRSEIFYPSFRQSFVFSIEKGLETPSAFKQDDVQDQLEVLKFLAPDVFLRLVRNSEDLQIAARYLENVEGSPYHEMGGEERAVTIGKDGSIGYGVQRLLFSGREFLPSHGRPEQGQRSTVAILIEVLQQISPSYGQSWPCEYVLTTMIDFCHRRATEAEFIEVMRTEWEEVAARLRMHLLPLLRELSLALRESGGAISSSRRIEDAIEKIGLVVTVLEDLQKEALMGGPDLETIAESFEVGIDTLRKDLFSDEVGSLSDILAGIICELRALVRNVADQRRMKTILEDLRVDLALDLPDEACYAFGHPNDLILAVSNLLENLEHAFDRGFEGERLAVISVVKARSAGTITITVRDNGRLESPVVPGVGLSRVHGIAESLGGGLKLPEIVRDSIFRTEVILMVPMIPDELMGRGVDRS